MSWETEQVVQDANRLVQSIAPLFANQDAAVIGTTLAELFAMFLAGYAPERRSDAKQLLFELVDTMLPIVEEFTDNGAAHAEWRQ